MGKSLSVLRSDRRDARDALVLAAKAIKAADVRNPDGSDAVNELAIAAIRFSHSVAAVNEAIDAGKPD